MTKNKPRNLAGTEKQIYDNDLDYVLARPGIYVGSINEELSEKFVYIDGKLSKKVIKLNPGLLKIVDEIIANSVDEAIKSNFTFGTKIDVIFENGNITVEDNGRGIEVVKDSALNKYLPEILFTNLKSGSNFDDDSGSESAGVNGLGSVLTNIFSKEFCVETRDGKFIYNQKFENNCKKIHDPVLKKMARSGKKGTTVDFLPDYDFFKTTDECKEHLQLLVEKRVRDLAFCYPEIQFSFNSEAIKTKGSVLLDDITDQNQFAESDKVRFGICKSSDDSFNSISFVNGCDTPTGTHVNYVVNKVATHLQEFIKKKHKIDVKTSDVKMHMFIMFSLRMPKPKFSSQTKEDLNSPNRDFRDRIDAVIDEKFLKKLTKNEEIIDSIKEIYTLRDKAGEALKLKKLQKTEKRLKIPKYMPAISKKKSNNILFIAEGDSAISSLSSVREDNMAGFPIRGKFTNVYGSTPVKALENTELNMICQIIGLKIGKKADNINFGQIAILSDQDHDGNAIAGLLLNFFYKWWPELIEGGKVVRVLSPLFIARNGKQVKRFYDHDAYHNWEHDDSWKVFYNKGLGSLGKEEYKYMVTNMRYLQFSSDKDTKPALSLVYGPDADMRKEWLS